MPDPLKVKEYRKGFFRLDPLPPAESFDEETYKDIDSRRESDAEWWEQEYQDRIDLLNRWAVGRNLLDVGCGLGQFVDYANANGWAATGIDPHAPGAHNITIEHVETKDWDAITLYKVLEHVREPQKLLSECCRHLVDGGVIQVTVPNDFSMWQKATGKEPYWVNKAHLNYFSMEALGWGLANAGFSIVHRTTDFPMEMFLLMGQDYVDGFPQERTYLSVSKGEVGSWCHLMRKQFEKALGPALRREFYDALAKIGVGRICQITARKHG